MDKRTEGLTVVDSHHEAPQDAHAHSHRHDPPLDVQTSPESPQSPESSLNPGQGQEKQYADIEAKGTGSEDDLSLMPSQAEAAAQLVGVAVLEFGVVLHRYVHRICRGIETV